MLTESKITIASAVTAFNSVLGVSGYELLQIYFLSQGSSEEVSALNNLNIESTKIERKKNKTVFWKGAQNEIDPRIHTTSNTTVEKSETRYRAYRFHTITSHKPKFVDWKESKDWWEKTYETRKYMLKNGNFGRYVNIVGGYEDKKYLFATSLHLNQFCDKSYSEGWYFKKYEPIFWLMCTTDAVNPDSSEEAKAISKAKKAKFPKGQTEEEIIYLTVEQSKKGNIKNAQIQNNRNKFVIYNYSQKWWEWSYQYRLEEDKKNETSAFPLSNKFKNVNKGWDISNDNATALNKVCEDFYLGDSQIQDEIEDAWRYCSDKGEKE
ncbi:hypothetical protein [Candidatus Mycoplasma haematohominis]|uniref:hypothetical protein n=1 Tax=Candidatus Mycoplasma haematohominis TaxID=1494318 RepID=UPI001C0A6A63|nr:hypothetical protein [Candidatus Mycoplasma haemohominis]